MIFTDLRKENEIFYSCNFYALSSLSYTVAGVYTICIQVVHITFIEECSVTHSIYVKKKEKKKKKNDFFFGI